MIYVVLQIEAIHQFEQKLPVRCLEKLYVPRLVIHPNSGSMSFIRKLTVRVYWYLLCIAFEALLKWHDRTNFIGTCGESYT